jgi:hypothetical protein
MASKVIMVKRRIALVAIICVAAALAVAWMVRSGKIAFLSLERHWTIQVNGTPVPGEILNNKFTAIVTRRDEGKQHSYQLFFEGDTDFTGDMGLIVDCGQWVAPQLPLLLETSNYPPCKRLLGDVSDTGRWPLVDKGKSMQFSLKDHTVITISR